MKYGYACINTVLRKQKIYVNRSMIQKTFLTRGLQYTSVLALQNVKDLFTTLKWNHEHKIFFYRMSSDMFPWMSEYQLEDLPDFCKIKLILKQIGTFATANHHRLTFHPGQFDVLASPKDSVVRKTIKDLQQHAQIMDLMSLPQSPYAKINVHVGGTYGKKLSTLNRWCNNFKELNQSTRSRLTLENDDKPNGYTTYDLLWAHELTGIPITFDSHHHVCNCNPISCKRNMKLACNTWPKNITPVIHVSQQRPGKSIRAHDDFVQSFDTFGLNVDVMFEAKQKEQAVLRHLKLA